VNCGTVIKMKAGGSIEKGALITIKDGLAYAVNPPHLEIPTSRFNRWVRVHILRKEPKMMPNPDYIGPPVGLAMGSTTDGEIIVVLINDITTEELP